MRRSTFLGGIHTYDGKELTMDKPTTVLLPKGDLVYPMSQHIGSPAKPNVAKGDRVLVGQRIGEAQGVISSNIISSVSGTVKAIEKRLTVSGDLVESIIVVNDNEYQTIEGFGETRDYKKLTKVEIRELIKAAGIVGMGGAGFPTHVKLSPKDDSKVEYIIVNASECEPYLTSDYRAILEHPEELVEGLKIILCLFENAKGVIAIEDNKPVAIKLLKELTDKEDNIEVKVLKTKYPQGAERQLISAALGRKINSSMLPYDAGCIVNNVDSVISIYSAVALGKPLIRRIVTVTGDAIKDPRNFQVSIGTNYSELAEAAGGFVSRPEKIISGGPMMGQALFTLDIPVTKTSSALLCFLKDEAAVEETPCIRCGRCVEVCPSRLVTQKVADSAARFDEEEFEKLHGMECCACGSCTYECPAKRNLTQTMKQTRLNILSKRKK